MKKLDEVGPRPTDYSSMSTKSGGLRSKYEILREQRFLIAGLLVLVTVTAGALLLLREEV